jgi:hypothetical protein
MTKKQWKLIWEQENYPDDPEQYHGRYIELEKTFRTEDEVKDFIKGMTKSARIIQKYFSVKKVLKCDKNGNWCEENEDSSI